MTRILWISCFFIWAFNLAYVIHGAIDRDHAVIDETYNMMEESMQNMDFVNEPGNEELLAAVRRRSGIRKSRGERGGRSRRFDEESMRDPYLSASIAEGLRDHYKSRNKKTQSRDPTVKGERAIQHMNKIHDKTTILDHLSNRVAHRLTPEDIDRINTHKQEYLELEKKVAALIQQTHDEFSKAREIRDRDERLAYIAKAKEDKKSRQDKEKSAREVARKKFLEAKQYILDIHAISDEL